MAVVERNELVDGVVELRLNRPERLNAITFEVIASLIDHLDVIAGDDAVRVVVITGEGRGFCAGADLKRDDAASSEMPSRFMRPGVIGMLRQTEFYAEAVVRMHKLDKPIIAAVNGPATGGGLAFVLGSDIRIAAESARFAASFVRAGLSGCDMGVSWLLPRVVGAGNAHELMLTGRIIEAAEAHSMGLVVDVVPDDHLRDRVLEEAEMIMANTPWGVEMTKQVMWTSLEVSGLEAAIAVEARTQTLTTTTADNSEATAAWVERRSPHFELG